MLAYPINLTGVKYAVQRISTCLFTMQVTYRYFLKGADLWTAQVGIAVRSRNSGQILAPNIIGKEPIVSEKTYVAISPEMNN